MQSQVLKLKKTNKVRKIEIMDSNQFLSTEIHFIIKTVLQNNSIKMQNRRKIQDPRKFKLDIKIYIQL